MVWLLDIPKKQKVYVGVMVIMTAIAIASCFMVESPRTATVDAPIDKGDTAWMLTSSALVLFMTPGLAFFYGGMVGSRNVISTMLQSIVAMGIISIFWVIVGFSLCFGDDAGHFIGKPWTFWMFHDVGGHTDPNLSPTIPLVLYAAFQLKFAIITPALITGSFAERVRFPGYVTYILIWSCIVYCPLCHWAWHPEGFLRQWGVIDFAGGTVVHMSAGWAALAGAIMLGRRKAHKEKEPHVAANVPFVILGTGLLWFGWFGFNAGSAVAANENAAIAFMTTNTAAATAMMTWLFFDGAQGKRMSATGACVGAVVGLVVITPASGYVSVQSSIFIGFIGAIISNIACTIKSKTSLDDTLDVFPCHGVGGMTGLICTGFFADDVGVVAGKGKTFGYHWLCLIIVSSYCFTMSIIIYKVLNYIMPLRVDAWKEEQGLDVSQHGESLYTFENVMLDASTCSAVSRQSSFIPMVGARSSYAPPQETAKSKATGSDAEFTIGTDVTFDRNDLGLDTNVNHPTPATSPAVVVTV